MAFDFYQQYPGKEEREKTAKEEAAEFKMPIGRLATTTNPFVPKQLEEFGIKLNTGIKNIEVGSLELKNFEAIPTQHFQEIKRLAKLTGTSVSMHGPLVDIAGFGEGSKWSEQTRKETEQQMISILRKANELSDKGNMPVVFHSSHNAMSNFYDHNLAEKNKTKLPEDLGFLKEESERLAKKAFEQGDEQKAAELQERANIFKKNKKLFEKGELPIVKILGVVNRENGQFGQLQFEEKRIMTQDGKEKMVAMDPYSQLNEINSRTWTKEKMNFNSVQQQEEQILQRMRNSEAEQQLHQTTRIIQQLEQKKEKKELTEEEESVLTEAKTKSPQLREQAFMESKQWEQQVKIIRKDRENLKEEIVDKFFKLASEPQKTKFIEAAKKQQKEIREEENKYQKLINNSTDDFEKLTLRNDLETIKARMEFNMLGAMDAPEIFKPVEDFAQEKFSETVSNVMMQFAKERGFKNLDTAPILAIENFFPNSPMSTGQTLRDGIEKARNKFADQLSKDSGFQKEFKDSKEKAKEFSEKLIGATWDMGHINMLRKSGYNEKDLKGRIISETQKIADMVKHAHITDNFGFDDSHLCPGMGNVPVREVLETLEKQGKFKGIGVLESGGVINAFNMFPYHKDFEFFHSPIYLKGGEAQNSIQKVRPPYWSAEYPNFYTDTYIEYPQQHFNLYGSGFSTLPKSIGGESGGSKSRFSGAPNQ